MSSSSTLIAQRYRLTRQLGSGGMGRVWLAQDVKLDRKVAVKEIIPPKQLSDRERTEIRLRTLREARTAASLSHPNVVRVFDTMNIDDQPWIVMEYVPSRSLQEVIDTDGPMSPFRAADIGLCVLAALRTAHKAGVLHRDVKPGNVLLADDGRVVLTDFGLATFDGDPQVTRTGLILGSPQYIAPERASEGHSLPESDLWSFGATLYAAVEGRAPYARPNALATLTALVTEDPDPMVYAGPLKPALDALLRKDPARRPSAEAVERLLRRVIAKSPADIRAALRAPTVARPVVVVKPAQPVVDQAAPASPDATVVVNSGAATMMVRQQDPVASDGLTRPAPPVMPVFPVPLQRGKGATTIAEARVVLHRVWHRRRAVRYAIVVVTVAGVVAVGVTVANWYGDGGSQAENPRSSVSASAGAPGPSSPSMKSPLSSFSLPAGWKWHTSTSGFQVAVPETWSLWGSDSGGARLVHPEGSPEINISAANGSVADPVAYWAALEGTRSQKRRSYTKLKIERVGCSFTACADWEYTYKNGSGTVLHVRDRVVATASGRGYELFWLATEDEWQASLDTFATIMASFRPAP